MAVVGDKLLSYATSDVIIIRIVIFTDNSSRRTIRLVSFPAYEYATAAVVSGGQERFGSPLHLAAGSTQVF